MWEPHPALRTPFCELVGVDYPIVQTGMGWVSGPELTAATSSSGGLGILAAATLTPDQLESSIAAIRALTDKPFGVNLRADSPDAGRVVEIIVEHGVPLASFAGPPSKTAVTRLKDAGVLVMPTIGAPKHAVKMVGWGVDALIAQGGEGGGHTGSIATSLLLPAVCRAVDVPVLGAGGFKDGRGLVAALAFGASGVAMGTRFLLTRESQVPAAEKEKYLEAKLTGTVVTRAIDGYPQRVIRTPLIDGLEKAGWLRKAWLSLKSALAFRRETGTSLPAMMREGLAMKRHGKLTFAQTIMAANAPMMTRATMVEGRVDVGILPTGQVAGAIGALPPVAEVIAEIMREADETLSRLSAGGVPSARERATG